jgi:hypothetical protein
MPTHEKSPQTIAQDIVRDWRAHNRIIIDPLVATDLVSRIEAEIAFDRVRDRRWLWKRSLALLVGSLNLVAMTGLIAIAALFSFALIGLFGLIIFA